MQSINVVSLYYFSSHRKELSHFQVLYIIDIRFHINFIDHSHVEHEWQFIAMKRHIFLGNIICVTHWYRYMYKNIYFVHRRCIYYSLLSLSLSISFINNIATMSYGYNKYRLVKYAYSCRKSCIWPARLIQNDLLQWDILINKSPVL